MLRALLTLIAFVTFPVVEDVPTPPTDLVARIPKLLVMAWELEGVSTNVPIYTSTDLRTWTVATNLPGGTVSARFLCTDPRRFYRVANQ